MKTCAALALLLLCGSRVLAHHAEAVFDRSQVLSVTGTVKGFLWANPHTLIYLEVADSSGRTDVNVFEGGSAVVMRRYGWSRDSLKVGDKLSISYHPRRDRKPGGLLITATLADGKKLGWQPVTTP
jgi:hypothetical protein